MVKGKLFGKVSGPWTCEQDVHTAQDTMGGRGEERHGVGCRLRTDLPSTASCRHKTPVSLRTQDTRVPGGLRC